MNIVKLRRRLDRLKGQLTKLESTHVGNELKKTYWGGYEMGYLKGKISEIEDILDDVEEEQNESDPHMNVFKWLSEKDYLSDNWELIYNEFKNKFAR
jgi:hypothetical protein